MFHSRTPKCLIRTSLNTSFTNTHVLCFLLNQGFFCPNKRILSIHWTILISRLQYTEYVPLSLQILQLLYQIYGIFDIIFAVYNRTQMVNLLLNILSFWTRQMCLIRRTSFMSYSNAKPPEIQQGICVKRNHKVLFTFHLCLLIYHSWHLESLMNSTNNYNFSLSI